MPTDDDSTENRRPATAAPPSGAGDDTAEPGPSIRGLLLWVTLGYTAFVIYGSLVPLHFRPQSLSAAWASVPAHSVSRSGHRLARRLGRQHPAVRAARVLLAGVLWPTARARRRECSSRYGAGRLHRSEHRDRVRADLLSAAHRLAQRCDRRGNGRASSAPCSGGGRAGESSTGWPDGRRRIPRPAWPSACSTSTCSCSSATT